MNCSVTTILANLRRRCAEAYVTDRELDVIVMWGVSIVGAIALGAAAFTR